MRFWPSLPLGIASFSSWPFSTPPSKWLLGKLVLSPRLSQTCFLPFWLQSTFNSSFSLVIATYRSVWRTVRSLRPGRRRIRGVSPARCSALKALGHGYRASEQGSGRVNGERAGDGDSAWVAVLPYLGSETWVTGARPQHPPSPLPRLLALACKSACCPCRRYHLVMSTEGQDHRDPRTLQPLAKGTVWRPGSVRHEVSGLSLPEAKPCLKLPSFSHHFGSSL